MGLKFENELILVVEWELNGYVKYWSESGVWECGFGSEFSEKEERYWELAVNFEEMCTVDLSISLVYVHVIEAVDSGCILLFLTGFHKAFVVGVWRCWL